MAGRRRWQSSVKHCGACQCCASMFSLNWTRWRTGSQCNCQRTGDMWSRRRAPVIRRAAAFWTAWSPASVHQQYHTWDCCSSLGVLTRTTGYLPSVTVFAASTDSERTTGCNWHSWWYADRHVLMTFADMVNRLSTMTPRSRAHNPHSPLPQFHIKCFPLTIFPNYLGYWAVQRFTGYLPSVTVDPPTNFKTFKYSKKDGKNTSHLVNIFSVYDDLKQINVDRYTHHLQTGSLHCRLQWNRCEKVGDYLEDDKRQQQQHPSVLLCTHTHITHCFNIIVTLQFRTGRSWQVDRHTTHDITRNKSIVPRRTMHTGRMSGHSTKKDVNCYVNNYHA